MDATGGECAETMGDGTSAENLEKADNEQLLFDDSESLGARKSDGGADVDSIDERDGVKEEDVFPATARSLGAADKDECNDGGVCGDVGEGEEKRGDKDDEESDEEEE